MLYLYYNQVKRNPKKKMQRLITKYMFNVVKKQPIQSLVQIVSKTPVNHDSFFYELRFVDTPIRIDFGQHLRITHTIKTYDNSEGEQITRKYTPINPVGQHDILQLLVKIYRANVDIKYPNGGKFTPFLEKLTVGDKLHVQGPFGNFNYQTGGNVTIRGQKKKVKRIFNIAGGSGITPVYQIIRQIVNMPNQDVQLHLLFANKTQEDILLRKELQSMQPRLKIHYTLDNPPQGWNGYSGYVTQQMLKKICPLNDPDTLYTHCGPFAMNAQIKHLFQTKYPQSTLYKF